MKKLISISTLSFLVSLMTGLVGSFAQAEISYSMPALEVGFKLNTVDNNLAATNKQSQAFQAGGSIVFDFGSGNNRDFGLKTGLFYSERSFKNDFTGGYTSEGKITYAEIPLQLMFKFEDYAGIYFGPTFSTKLSDECKNSDSSTCSLTGVKSTIVPLTFGAQFKVASNFGLGLFFETISGELADHLKSSRGLGLNFMFVFD